MQEYKLQAYEQYESLKKEMGENIRKKLEQYGIIEERIVAAIIEKFTRNVRGPDGGSPLHQTRLNYLLNSHTSNHERPPILVGSIIEMKFMLQNLAKQFSINSDLELDNGQLFSYSVQVIFPTHFQQQTFHLQFEAYDRAKESDYLNIERIAKNIELLDTSEKQQAMDRMKKKTFMDTKKSVIGRINADDWRSED